MNYSITTLLITQILLLSINTLCMQDKKSSKIDSSRAVYKQLKYAIKNNQFFAINNTIQALSKGLYEVLTAKQTPVKDEPNCVMITHEKTPLSMLLESNDFDLLVNTIVPIIRSEIAISQDNQSTTDLNKRILPEQKYMTPLKYAVKKRAVNTVSMLLTYFYLDYESASKHICKAVQELNNELLLNFSCTRSINAIETQIQTTKKQVSSLQQIASDLNSYAKSGPSNPITQTQSKNNNSNNPLPPCNLELINQIAENIIAFQPLREEKEKNYKNCIIT